MVEALLKEVTPQIDYKRSRLSLRSVVYEVRPKFLNRPQANRPEKPLEPIEPKPYSLNELEWKRYEKQRDAARAYALENDLRGTF